MLLYVCGAYGERLAGWLVGLVGGFEAPPWLAQWCLLSITVWVVAAATNLQGKRRQAHRTVARRALLIGCSSHASIEVDGQWRTSFVSFYAGMTT